MASDPFKVPASWEWAAIGDVFLYDAGTKREPTVLDQKQWLLELEDIEKDTGRLLVRTRVCERESRSTKSEFHVGDILYGKLRPYLNKVLVADKPGYSTTEIVALRPHLPLRSEYCALALRRPFDFVDYVTRLGQGTKMPRLRTEDAVKSPFPLPPLAEQHRIVARVNELMALCDRLEAARAEREATRDRLATASLARLNAPNPDPARFQHDVTFALNNLAPLTTRPDQIKALRQTILNLAVQGKLVEQDPNDEPASELLRRLRANTDGKARRKARNSEDINAGEVPFECLEAAGWTWTKVQQTLNPDREISYGVIKLGDEPRAGGIPTLRCSDVRAGFIDRSGVRKVDEAIESEYARTRLLGGEVVINIRGTLGGVALVPHDLNGFNVAREVAVVPIANEISGPFVVYLMLSPYFWDHIQNNLRGIAYKGLNLGILREIPIPLPPLAEQRRIVGKVNELMALCNQLEASLATGDETRGQLVDALLQEALNLDANSPKPKQTLRIM